MIPRLRGGVRVRREAFGALIFTNRTPILALNEDSLAIWELIDGTRTDSDIVESIEEGRAALTGVKAAVDEFLTSCMELGLIELIPLSPATLSK